MMGDFDLLDVVQPRDGWFAVMGIKDEGGELRRKQLLLESRDEVDTTVAKLVKAGWNAFFGVAKFTDDSGRKKENVRSLRSFWLDIDCGPDKPYETQGEGLVALKNFCKVIGLPRPIIVNSGRGLHVYWPLSEDITRADWEQVADKLRAACVTHKLYADPACFEVSRVLRVPGTFNFKGDEPAPVEVLATHGELLSHEEIRDILGVKGVALAPREYRPMSALTQQLQQNIQASFNKIMSRPDTCLQLRASYEERETLSEPRWFAALSIAKFCKDKNRAIHKLSSGHPDYDPDTTEQKTRHIVGPHTCTEFEKHNPGVCKLCPHHKKIKSPIVLGKELLVATDADNLVQAPSKTTDDNAPQTVTYRIPDYPFPYARGKNGGVYRLPMPDAEVQEPILIYPRDFYIVKRMEDPQHGEVTLMRLHTPNDGVKEFVIPNFKVMDGTELRKTLASHGIVTNHKVFGALVDYVVSSVNKLQDDDKAEQMRNQFGWADKDSKFIIGDREVCADGTYHSPPSSMTAAIAEHMVPAGSFEKWKEVFDLYGKPGLEANAFAAATGFGAPLLKFSGHSGAIINLIHPRSGTGKTTVLHMANSIWGHPKKLCAKKDDTFNSKIHKMGVHNNLPICFDEMSNVKPEVLSELGYLVSQGEGKDRMKGSSNELRLNLTSWQTIALCSSNHSFYEKLEYLKNTPEGEMMRIMEYHLDYSTAIPTDFAKEMFDHQLLENYGHAGERYARYLLTHYKEVKALYATIQQRLDHHLKLTQRERFWSAVAAANLTGIHIAITLGLCSWDLARIFKWTCRMLLSIRGTTTPPPDGEKQVLGEFIISHMQNTLVVNDAADARMKMTSLPILEPRGDLVIRYEPDTKRVYIVARAFKEYCQRRNASNWEIIRKLEKDGVYLGTVQKRINKGTQIPAGVVQCLVFDAAHPDFIALDEVVERAKANTEEDATEEA